MDTETLDTSPEVQQQRNIFIRVISAIFWLFVTMLTVQVIVGGVIGGMAGTEISGGQPMSVGEAAGAGAAAGQKAAEEFFIEHGGKVFLFNLFLWLALLITGKFPWVSKFKQPNA